ncbi:hypothetical protein [Legionella longbeachae]|uniref:Uncharacterized protein n=1 Tax=Legionella longbeachae serogroup 1 (strain NSW150) TaxID=661367 RepID=D3HR17_LEGLN|nr:hypothetical protein [Legionella longbeachae]VEE01854.1 Uncharacterised protein [Legionella oakridgensis]HBD7399476.1 hypothetical protein [Legionella pneumophila]ARB91828.1 hypothetical protein A6J40_06350 [Legionella longbeachae]ARM35027.1 hypothetical protein B0B39_16600 [Legionella longbeachae]EEZ95554.1 hypothetical protein LLB_0730 [Legionella longbeachae D-4968]
MDTNIELNAMNPSESRSNEEIGTTDEVVNATSEDVYKYQKISLLIPKLITTIEQIEMLDQNTEMNIELKKSRKRLASIVIDNTSPNAEDIKEFTDSLSSALYGLSTGMSLIDMRGMIPEKKNRAVDLFADISLIQEDIVKLAS